MITFCLIISLLFTHLRPIDLDGQMKEVSLLIDAVSQLDEPFSLVIVVIVC